jgi:CBS domain-containing protein
LHNQIQLNIPLLFLSRLVGRPLQDSQGEKIAILKDLIVRINPEEGKSPDKYPPLAALVARTGGRDFFVPFVQVTHFSEEGIKLVRASVSLEKFRRRDGEILLGRDVLDRQLVDVEGRRVIRVNDLALSRAPNDEDYRLVGVDVSFQAILRRLWLNSKPVLQRQVGLHDNLLDWADVEYFASEAPTVRLNVSHNRMAKLHPVDIARLMEELSYRQGTEIVQALDDETAADALEEMEPEYAADILESLAEARAADILEEMEPDDAADLMAELDEEKAENLLNQMETEESDDLKELLSYEEDTVGSIMTNDFLTLSADLTVGQALDSLRDQEDKPEHIYYIYVVEPGQEKVVGAISLRTLVLATPTTPLTALMRTTLISVTPEQDATEAARIMVEYRLLVLPVLDEEGDLIGVITFDDALERLLPDVRQARTVAGTYS